VRAQNIAPSIFLALLMFAAGHVAAADPKPETIPPFCEVSRQCDPAFGAAPRPASGGNSADPAPKSATPAPKKDEWAGAACQQMSGVTGKCAYLTSSTVWACCSKNPYFANK